jgi:hypothetical protein
MNTNVKSFHLLGALLLMCALAQPKIAAAEGAGPEPRIIGTFPTVGAQDVDPTIKEITITFDQDMAGGFSWTGPGPNFPPSPQGEKPIWRDKRTCALPVKLEAGKFYRVGINSPSRQNFRTARGVPVKPSEIHFTTAGPVDEANKPKIISMQPANGATEVDPTLKEIRVTFNIPMRGSFSWTGGGPQFPGAAGKRPYWTDDKKTCVLPVDLKPNSSYSLGLNSPSHKNFQSSAGIPLDPVPYKFKTK